MLNTVEGNLEPVAPTAGESVLARESGLRLSALLRTDTRRLAHRPVEVHIQEGDHTEVVVLPASTLPLLNHILEYMAQGSSVSVLPSESELTTQQAADLLNVSRPFLIGLLEQGEIPFRKVGKHRRMLLSDVLSYKRRNIRERLSALEELEAQAQELGLGYGLGK